MIFTENIKEAGEWDILVAGGGVAGVAAAVSGARAGKSVVLIEKTVNLGGLATNGLINLFVPMCNGRGTQIIFGLCDELLKLSYKYGWTSMNDSWKNGYEVKNGRMVAHYSPAIFSLAMVELLRKEGVTLYLDTVLDNAVVNNGKIDGVIITSKSGREYIKAKMFVDATGDADLLYRAGVPTVDGKNYFTYAAKGINKDTVKRYLETNKMHTMYRNYMGGTANLYGGNHPEGKKFYVGVTKEDVTEYITDNQMVLLENIKGTNPDEFDLTVLPSMPQFRTTRRLDGDATFTVDDAYKHKDDSICAICDFDRKDYLYEVPFASLVKTGYKNVISSGRCTSAIGYGWDVVRVIPPAILTGQAAGEACALAIESNKPIYAVDIKTLQARLEKNNVIIHFDDALIPKEQADESKEDNGHF